MALPLVAIIGRPNVGKSTFFNYLAGTRISIVDDTPGVTRDRIYSHASWCGREFAIVDTGGIETESSDDIQISIREQARTAIETADVMVFITDLKSGLTASDKSVAEMLRKSGKPVVVAVNKVDRPGQTPPEVYEFYELAIGEVYPISSVHGLGIGDLLDGILAHLPEEGEHPEDSDVISVAFIGKPNAGKSSIVNKVLGYERTIVSEKPGTTRDAIDSLFENKHGKFNMIDTAGLRRKGRIEKGVEKYSAIRSLAAIERADVCVVIIDAVDNVTEQDTKIAGYAIEAGKACILAVNKWDLVEKDTGVLEKYKRSVRESFSFMDYAPVIFVSAATGQRLDKLFETIVNVKKQAEMRISTGALNDLIGRAVAIVPTPQDKGKHLKIYYAAQAGIKPPTFILFINNKELMHFSYERYLENQLRKYYGFEGTPIRFILRPKDDNEIRKRGMSVTRRNTKRKRENND